VKSPKAKLSFESRNLCYINHISSMLMSAQDKAHMGNNLIEVETKYVDSSEPNI
jgi:hypothetical protein